MAERVLVVEDEPDVLDALVQLLAHAGYEARGEADGLAGLRAFQEALRSVPFDLVMLDVMMPRIDGFTLCEAIRSSSDVPVMVITALDGEDDQLRAFRLLADDFVSKPFSLPVVLERARALLRRSSARPAPADAALAWRDVVLDPASRELSRGGVPVGLTRTEFDVLLALMSRPGRVLSRAELASAGGQADPADPTAGESAVKLHVMNIRRKLGADVVETVRGVGYRVPRDR
ncbi:response regulator transcription factor [Thermophilibacter provencensis]|uniref:response regulator transcription factor n=1 Tax=Thermophilibacter provencensis TaxID=1852386 RepID=UPI00094AD147|nr:response regulator transcription factor [Thermophilibacter provencensis]